MDGPDRRFGFDPRGAQFTLATAVMLAGLGTLTSLDYHLSGFAATGPDSLGPVALVLTATGGSAVLGALLGIAVSGLRDRPATLWTVLILTGASVLAALSNAMGPWALPEMLASGALLLWVSRRPLSGGPLRAASTAVILLILAVAAVALTLRIASPELFTRTGG